MQNNRENSKRAIDSILLSLSLLTLAKQTEFVSDKKDDSFSDVFDCEKIKILPQNGNEIMLFPDVNCIDSSSIEQRDYFTDSEVSQLICEGIILREDYGDSPFCSHYIKVETADGDYQAPQGYNLYQELLGIENSDGMLYFRTPNYLVKKQTVNKVLKL